MRWIPLLAALALACAGDDDELAAVDAGADASDEVPAMCGGIGGIACESADFCDYIAHSCGASDGTGSCRARPSNCDGAYAPVCGCDGMVHGNECQANAAGVDASDTIPCDPPEGHERCGYRFCPKTQACMEGGTDEEPEYTCVDA
jgi:hypothetical protein